MNCEHYLVKNTNLEAYGLSVTGQVRKANEDSCGFATVPNGELFVVCDGMGGHVGGATASRIAVEQIIQHFQAQLYPNVYEALRDALCRANIQILGAAVAEPSLKGMGTTACIVLVNGNDAYIAHVGDSRIYLFEAEKKRLFRITKDHSFVQSLVDMGQLDDRDAEHHPRKNVIMKALGTKEELVPEVYPSPVQPAKGDMFLICSDGLSGMVDDNGIEAILSSDQSTEQKVLDLVNNANVPGKGLDNITAQVIKVVESPYPVSNHPDHNPRWRNEPDGGMPRDVDMSSQLPPQAVKPPKKQMSSKLLALIIVGGLLMLIAAGAIGYWIYRSGFEEKRLQKEAQNLREEIKQFEKDSIKYSTSYQSSEFVRTEYDKINGKLKDDRKKLAELEAKIAGLEAGKARLGKTKDKQDEDGVETEPVNSDSESSVKAGETSETEGNVVSPSKAEPAVQEDASVIKKEPSKVDEDKDSKKQKKAINLNPLKNKKGSNKKGNKSSKEII